MIPQVQDPMILVTKATMTFPPSTINLLTAAMTSMTLSFTKQITGASSIIAGAYPIKEQGTLRPILKTMPTAMTTTAAPCMTLAAQRTAALPAAQNRVTLRRPPTIAALQAF